MVKTGKVGLVLFLGCAAVAWAQETRIARSLTLGVEAMYSRGRFDIYGEVHDIGNYGPLVRIDYRVEPTRVVGLELGASAWFLHLGNEIPGLADTLFDVDIDPTPDGVLTTGCEMKSSVTCALVMAQWAYTMRAGPLSLGVEAGVGLAFLYERNDWNIDNPADTTLDLAADLERRESLKPAIEYGLRVGFRLGQHHRVGLTGGGLGFPILMKIDDVNYGVTPNLYYDLGPYQIHHAWRLGVFWQATS